MSYLGIWLQKASVDLVPLHLLQELLWKVHKMAGMFQLHAWEKKEFCLDKIYIYFPRVLFYRRSWPHAEDQTKVFGFSLDCVLAIKEKAPSANHNWLPQRAMPCASLMGTRHSQSVWNSPLTWPGFQPGTIQFIRVISKAVTKEVSMEIDSITSQLVHSLPPILNLFLLFPWL